MTSKSKELGLTILKHRQYISVGIFEPRYVWASALTAMNTFCVCLNIAFVTLKTDTEFGESVHCVLNIGYPKIEHSEGGRLMVGFGIYKNLTAAGKPQPQTFFVLVDFQPQRLAVKVF